MPKIKPEELTLPDERTVFEWTQGLWSDGDAFTCISAKANALTEEPYYHAILVVTPNFITEGPILKLPNGDEFTLFPHYAINEHQRAIEIALEASHPAGSPLNNRDVLLACYEEYDEHQANSGDALSILFWYRRFHDIVHGSTRDTDDNFDQYAHDEALSKPLLIDVAHRNTLAEQDYSLNPILKHPEFTETDNDFRFYAYRNA